MTRRAQLGILMFVTLQAAHAQEPVSSSVTAGFEARRTRLLEIISRERGRDFNTVIAKLTTGYDRAYALGMLDSLTTDESIGGMFYSYAGIGTYLKTRERLPDSLRQKVRQAYRTRTMYRGDTENHWVMYYTGLYLAAQTWPNEGRSGWFNGKSSSENFSEAEEWLNRWFTITSTVGQGEFDSPTYFITFITPMLTLFDCATDPLMKRKAGMMADLLFADYAVEHLKGNYAGGHSRDYPDDIVNPLSAPAALWAWLYFGEPEIELWKENRFRPRNRGSWETVFGATSSYRLPEVIYNIGTDRSRPYVHQETKRVRNIIRFGKELNPPVFKYTYMTNSYALGSLHGGILQPIQQHTWDVTFASTKTNNTIFTLHPFVSGKELAMFFPEEQKFLADEVNRYHLVYTNPNKWNSSSPYEETFQHKNAILVLYRLSADAQHQHIDGFFPKNLDVREIDKSGWIFCAAGSVYVGVYPLKPYVWIEEPINWRLRSSERTNGVAVEVGSADEDGTFDRFKARLKSRKPQILGEKRSFTLRYTTRNEDCLEFTFGGERSLNGKRVDRSLKYLYQGPFMESERGSGNVRLMYDGRVRELNFRNAEVKEWRRQN